MKPDAVIFDVDGTLIDSVDLHARAWSEAFAAFGRDVPFDTVRGQIGKGGDQLLPVFLAPEEIETLGKQVDAKRSEIFKQRFLDTVRAFPDVRPLFERLRSDGIRIALASSSKGDELERYKRIAAIEDLTDEQTTSDDAERSKPHPDIFAAVLDRLGNPDPARVLVVGDTPYDAAAATKLGMRTVGVLCGGFPETDLRREGAVAIFRDPAELLARYGETPFRTL